MKVVLFCGGQGMRLREHSESIPKPMVPIGYRPILWHLMKYYAHFGHKEFILCLGWQADVIKNYFLNYDECTSNDFVLRPGDRQVELLNSDLDDWSITFADTGVNASIGERLWAVREHLRGESTFMANYADGLTNMQLTDLVDFFEAQDTVGSFVAVRPSQTFHRVETNTSGVVSSLAEVRETDLWMNGGFFIFRQEIFDYLKPGEDLVEEPLRRLIAEGKLSAMKHEGFWACMDTYKEMQKFEERSREGDMPWQVWKQSISSNGKRVNHNMARLNFEVKNGVS